MSRSRVLVVDDDESILKLFEAALESTYDVVTARDGTFALDYLKSNDISCLVADHMMPGLTGVDLCREACNIRPHAGRVLVTATDRVEDLAAAVNVGHVHRFLPKPVRLSDLMMLVKDAVRTANLETENVKLVAELKVALVAVQESEKRLEREVVERTRELEVANAELAKLALRDGLTGLYNHRFFQESLTTELARSQRYGSPVSLIFVDVDHFKNYNDVCGHPAGDELLRQLSALLTSTDIPDFRFRGRLSDITARYGGEEFVIILPLTDKEGALVRAQAIRELIANHPFPRRDVQPGGIVSVSVGAAAFPRDAMDKASLIEAADAAMLAAKRNGRNRVVAAPEPPVLSGGTPAIDAGNDAAAGPKNVG